MALNLGMLGYFKYCNFFADVDAGSPWPRRGWNVPLWHIEVVLPIGISFYTFQSMSYVIDVYRKDIKPTKNLLEFATFVSFFPHLVAGPIMRPTTLLPQIQGPRKFNLDQIYQGVYLIFWGLTKKVVVADNLAPIVNDLFGRWQTIDGGLALLAIYAFAFQIYCDFSGYTDAARGIAKCLGIELALNFNLPYFATSPQDFWSRWHISLSKWLQDYLYIPLGGSRGGTLMTYRNLMLTMIIGGLWHGAAWTFVIWGTYQGLILVGHRLREAAAREDRPDPADRPGVLEGGADHRDVPPRLPRLADLPVHGFRAEIKVGAYTGVEQLVGMLNAIDLSPGRSRPRPTSCRSRSRSCRCCWSSSSSTSRRTWTSSRGPPGTSGASSTRSASTPSCWAASSAAASSSTSSSDRRGER